jgi:ankyrin repeat protein
MGTETLKVLLEEGISPDYIGDMGETCLHRAAASGLTSVMRQLIDAGASVNAQDSIGRTPLMRACAGRHLDAVSVLIADGADLAIKDYEGYSALSWASNQNHDILELLLAHKPPLDSVDIVERTSLLEACLARDCYTLQLLVIQGAQIDTRTNSTLFHKKTSVTLPPRCTPLMAAALMNHPVLIDTLTGANLEEQDSGEGRTSLLLAAEKGNYEAFQTLIRKGSLLTAKNSSGQSVLELAVKGGNVKILEHLTDLLKNELKSKKERLFTPEELRRAVYTGNSLPRHIFVKF